MNWRFWKRAASVALTELDRVAGELVDLYEPVTQSGEWKRHQVYAALRKRFPGVKGYLIGLAIELAVQRLRER